MIQRYLSFVALLAVAVFLADLSVYTVDQRENALVLQLGKVVAVDRNPGLYFKLPVLQTVRYFDTRVLTLNPPDPDHFMTAEKKTILVDYALKWRIIDPKQFYIRIGGDETRADNRLQQSLNDGLRTQIGKRSIQDIVSGPRNDILAALHPQLDQDAARLGIQVIDVRIMQIGLPPEINDAIYRRMSAERKSMASALRSTGAAEAEQIRANADRQREVIIADAWRDAQRVKGEGDASASAIYAAAYSQNPEFYNFYRSLNAYRSSFANHKDVLILDPHSPFFRYMNSPDGKAVKP